jgi:uncharacterized protein YdcH (DUF465 family)
MYTALHSPPLPSAPAAARPGRATAAACEPPSDHRSIASRNYRYSKEIRKMTQRDELKAELLQTDEQFRRLYEEHREYERRLSELNQKTLLSQDDEFEEKKIKLHKLALKDRMEEILRAHREARVSA